MLRLVRPDQRQGMLHSIALSARSLPAWRLQYAGWSFWTPFGETKPCTPTYWDGQVPNCEGSQLASDDPTVKNPQAWRYACKAKDLGWYAGEPQPKYEQGWPRKAIEKYQKARGYAVTGNFGPKLHQQWFKAECE